MPPPMMTAPLYRKEVFIMQHAVLGIGYLKSEYDDVRKEWKCHDVDFRFVDSVEDAVCQFTRETFVCITVCIDRVGNAPLDYLRKYNAPPIILIPTECSIEQRANLLQRGASDYLKNATSLWPAAQSSGKDPVQYYLDSQQKASDPLTIVTAGELYFCLEHRTVEVRGQPVELTPKEFDILALLITHPKRVFTFEMLIDQVWHDDYSFYSRKAIINHMSNLRKKLKVLPDIPEYVHSVHGVGYKFDAAT